jgi:hypothetical protein
VAGVSASVGGISVATGSPSQADFFKTGQVDRLHQDGPGGRGRVGRGLRTVTSRQACEHRWHARRSETVACDSLRAEEMQAEGEARNSGNNERAKVLVPMYSDMYAIRYVCI